MQRFATIAEVIAAARSRLPKPVWDYSAGGSDTEFTLRRNREAFSRFLFRPRILRNVRERSVATSFLGVPLALPVMLAPVGSIILFDPDGALASARAAHQAGSTAFISTLSDPGLESVAEGSDGPLFFQLYVRGERPWIQALIDRAARAGYRGVCVTADTALYGRRERDLHNRFVPRDHRGRASLPDGPNQKEYQAQLTWDDIVWLRSITDLPIVLKGVMTVEDALLAVEHGVNAICVSNHGGRQLDYSPSPMEVLGAITAAVGGRAEVIADSGFLRGTDVVKALALGARAVLIGKLQCWALAADGEAGLVRALELLTEEISTTMALLGVSDVTQLGRQHVGEYPACGPLPPDLDPR